MSLKLFIDHRMDESGKGKFLNRLVPELEKLGVEWSNKPGYKADVALVISRRKSDIGCPVVLRVDGVLFDNTKYVKWKNNRLLTNIKSSKAVIYQSEYCQKMGHGLLKYKHKREHVIYNGADPKDYKQEIPLPAGFKVITVANFAGRLHKRYREMTEIAAQYPEATFYIAGKSEIEGIKAPNIKYLGYVPEEELRKYLASVDCMLYLAHYDWCPNAVVEALVAGLPVIHCMGSGVSELVGNNYLMVTNRAPYPKYHNVSKKYQSKIRYKVRPAPKLDYQEVFKVLDLVKEAKPRGVRYPWLHIKNIAKQYLEVFESVAR